MIKMTFPASIEHLHDMLQFIREQVKAAGFSGMQETQIELALEEALVNIIKHGYKTYSGDITIQCILFPQELKVTLIDHGIPFNPCLTHEKRKEEEANDLHTMGGYGVYLILTIMDQVDYQFENGCNLLHLTKKLPKENQSPHP